MKKNGQATGAKTTKTTDKSGRQTVAKKPAKRPFGKRGVFNLMAGTRKEAVAQVAAKQGRTAALAKAEKLGLKASSARSWLAQWTREGHLEAVKAAHAKRVKDRLAKQGAKPADPSKLRQTAEQMRTAISTQAAPDHKAATG